MANDAPLTIPYSGTLINGKVLLVPSIQQVRSWACGPACIRMLEMHYLGTCRTEQEVIDAAGSTAKMGTSLAGMASGFVPLGWGFRSKPDCTMQDVKQAIDAGVPLLAAWHDFNGHWVAIVGYDNGSAVTGDPADDILILRDPWDKVDGVKDGYKVVTQAAFISGWYDAKYVVPGTMVFRIAATPVLAGTTPSVLR